MELRPEARPLRFADLDEQQRKAFVQVVNLLFGATEAVRSVNGAGSTRPTRPFANGHLPTRSILVDGERGMGKTTLLLSLEEALRVDRYGVPASQQFDLAQLPQEAADRVRSLQQRLVWLETLDMEPLSDEVNLLGAVLARLEDALDGPAVREPSLAQRLLCPGGEDHNVLSELARLQTSVALTFEGNLAQRSGSLDSGTFANESRKGERERLGLGRSFREVLGNLSGVFHGVRQLENPLFVLPVDDLDLSLGKSIALLQLLQAAQSPHLVVIMAADLALLSAILRLRYQGDLAKIAEPAGLESKDRSLVQDLAANVLRKYLPPTQRVPLKLADPAWVLDFRPVPDAPKLRDLLGGVELPPDNASLQLDTRFWPRDDAPLTGPASVGVAASTGEPLPTAEDCRIRAAIEGYSWPEALRIPARRVVDLHLGCWANRGEDQHCSAEPAGNALRRHAQDRLAEWASGLPSGRDEADFEMHPQAIRPPQRERTLVVDRTWRGWSVLRSGSPLTSDESAAFVGCFELANDWDHPWRLSAYMPPLRESHLPAGGGGEPIVIAWPWVSHSTFWAYERAAKWLRRADEQWIGQPFAPFGSWIAVMTAQLFDVTTDPNHPLDQPKHELARNWKSLQSNLGELGDLHSGTSLAHDWLLAVGLLCTPEMGMHDPRQLPAQFIPFDVERNHLPGPLDGRRAELQRAGVPETAFAASQVDPR
jgi:hypothetical protein